MFPVSTTPEEFFLMRSKQLLFCFTAAACIAIAADASAETRHNTSKSTGAATATTHAGPNTIHANQQGMSGMRANAGNRNFSAEERLTGARNGNPNFAAEERMSRRPGNRIFATEERMTGTRSYAGDRIYAGRDRFNGTRAFSENRTFIMVVMSPKGAVTASTRPPDTAAPRMVVMGELGGATASWAVAQRK
jgi:hypothetical protein